MKITIAGDTKDCIDYVRKFIEEHHSVTLINKNHDVCRLIAEEYSMTTLWEDATAFRALDQVNLERTDIFISLFDQDSDNYVCCKLAGERMNIDCCYAIVKNPHNIKMFNMLGVNVCYSPADSFFNMVKQGPLSHSV